MAIAPIQSNIIIEMSLDLKKSQFFVHKTMN